MLSTLSSKSKSTKSYRLWGETLFSTFRMFYLSCYSVTWSANMKNMPFIFHKQVPTYYRNFRLSQYSISLAASIFLSWVLKLTLAPFFTRSMHLP